MLQHPQHVQAVNQAGLWLERPATPLVIIPYTHMYQEGLPIAQHLAQDSTFGGIKVAVQPVLIPTLMDHILYNQLQSTLLLNAIIPVEQANSFISTLLA